MFTTEAGLVATAISEAIGLRLDKSQGLALGGELLANTEFNNSTGLTLGADWAVSGGQLIHSAGSASFVDQGAAIVAGRFYRNTLNVASVSGGSYAVQFGGGTTTTVVSGIALTGLVTIVGQARTGNNALRIFAGASTAIAINSASVRELLGNHASQSNATFRPLRSATGALYDGSDDRLAGTFSPTAAGTIAARFNGSTASRVIIGSAGASDGRAFLALDASGRIAAGIGAQGTSTIFGGADIRNEWHSGAVTWDGSTVRLYLDGVEVYSGAQSGAVNTTVPMNEGALNNNGTAASFFAGTIARNIALSRVMTPAEILNLHNQWST
jgi:hypothetical protein